MILGDFNSRIDESKDFIESDDIDDYLPLNEDYTPDSINLPKRTTQDIGSKVKGHGAALLDFCKSTGFRIGNGRLGSDSDKGNFTCYQPGGNSLVDYLLIKEKDFHISSDFEIGEMNGFSDHGFLKIKVKCHKTEEKVDNNNRNNIIYEQVGENLEMLRNNYISKFKVRGKSNETIFNSLNEEDLKRQIKDKLEIVSVSETVTTIRNILLKYQKIVLMK